MIASNTGRLTKTNLYKQLLTENQPHAESIRELHKDFGAGDSHSIKLAKLFNCLERILDVDGIEELEPMQHSWEAKGTEADTAKSEEWVCFKCATPTEQGVGTFIRWYHDFHKG